MKLNELVATITARNWTLTLRSTWEEKEGILVLTWWAHVHSGTIVKFSTATDPLEALQGAFEQAEEVGSPCSLYDVAQSLKEGRKRRADVPFVPSSDSPPTSLRRSRRLSKEERQEFKEWKRRRRLFPEENDA